MHCAREYLLKDPNPSGHPSSRLQSAPPAKKSNLALAHPTCKEIQTKVYHPQYPTSEISRLLLSIHVPSIHKHLLPLGQFNIFVHHHLHQLLKPDFRLPTQHLLRLARIPFQIIHLRRPQVPLVDHHVVSPVQSHVPKRHLQELLHRVRLLRRHHVVVRLLLLQHHPHRLHVVAGKTPVPRRLQIPQKQLALQSLLDPTHGPGDLPGHEILPPPRRLVVEQNPVAREQPVCLAVVHGVPMRRAFRNGVGGSGVERRRFGLRRRGGPEHLGRPGLVVLNVGAAGGGDVGADSLEEAEGAGGNDVGGVIGDLKRDGDVRLGGEVVDLVGGDYVEPAAEGGGVGEVGVVELHAGLVGVVGVDVDVVDALGVEVGGPSDQAVDVVAFVEEEFGEVGAVLAGDAGD
ncbi:hypothetical protein C1H46_036814 [Malus baccata]|uniref:Uncharacterized protein n=1 Tax=Malus baccata TaxID=106549 RepID=A0A540KTU7_MALBA|nr:hypothetical protein C1H46_036814 [Malus baccata]